MPVTMIRPLICDRISTQRKNGSDRPFWSASPSAAIPACSVLTVRRADSIAACFSGGFVITLTSMDVAITAFAPACPMLFGLAPALPRADG